MLQRQSMCLYFIFYFVHVSPLPFSVLGDLYLDEFGFNRCFVSITSKSFAFRFRYFPVRTEIEFVEWTIQWIRSFIRIHRKAVRCGNSTHYSKI